MRHGRLSFVVNVGCSLVSLPLVAQELPPPTILEQGLPLPEPAALQPLVPAAGDPLYAPLVTSSVPQSFHDRLMEYAIITVGPRALFVAPVAAAIRMVDPPETLQRDWRVGMGAYGRNYANAFTAETSSQTGRFLTGALLHEDFRYRPSTSRNFFARSFHALAFTFVDKSDSGDNRIAFANFAAAGAGGFVGNLYLPHGFNDLTHAETRAAFVFGGLAVENLLREFAPDIFNSTHKWRIPFPRIPLPEWWVKLPVH